MLKSSSSASCDLDPLPTILLKRCIPILAPLVTKFINLSLESGIFPADLKRTIVVPRLKKSDLSVNELKNFRPISNIPYLSKVTEKAVMSQFLEYLEENTLLPQTQSAYRKNHSVETALLRVQNDCLQALDTHKEMILVLLDFAAAFDTIDHSILMQRLSDHFGVSGNAMKWFHSYLSGRSHVVRVNDASSGPVEDTCGVPQGSVVGPLLFTLYTAPIQDIISEHRLQSMIYADDTQMYLTFQPSERESAIHRVNRCIADIHSWAGRNKLMINEGKTEVLHFSSKFIPKTPSLTVTVGETVVESKAEARNLGIKPLKKSSATQA